MYHFKQESILIKQLLAFTKERQQVVNSHSKAKVVLIISLCIGLTACTPMMTQRKVSHNLIKTPAIAPEKPVQPRNKPNRSVSLSGLWKIGYRYQGKSDLGSMQIQQSNEKFSGQGKDEHSNATFKVEQGLVKGDEILFLKRYDKHPNQLVQYHGQFSYLPSENGEAPYMGGDFSFEVNGVTTVGEWEAAMAAVKSSPETAPNNTKAEPEKSEQIVQQSHFPDLSGKWNVAYEGNFKTSHSIMFLEQDGHKIMGHGIDTDTKEKFIIKKGWYDFPHLTIVREYLTRSKGNSLITFKAEVSEVSDKDYTGPYLSGKTQGGGEWEAERIN